MNKYELLTIFSASLSDEQKDAIVDKYTKLMEKDGGKVELVNKATPWGLRKLAYPINYKNDGYYVLYKFESSADVAKNVVSLMRIDENVLRSMCLRCDK
ncbi:MAG: 30S ribosomal protein S6 [Firmicutes bacterium]|nr:30S ribosomal protein S6 [Bacillota bacterium]MDY5677125.1 30S ribosomal protein S6 [Eubacteriales bacterium]